MMSSFASACSSASCPTVAIISRSVSLGHSNRRLNFRTPATYVNLRQAFQEQTCFVSWPGWVIQRVCYLGSPSCILFTSPPPLNHSCSHTEGPTSLSPWISLDTHTASNTHGIIRQSITRTVSTWRPEEARCTHSINVAHTNGSMYTGAQTLCTDLDVLG